MSKTIINVIEIEDGAPVALSSFPKSKIEEAEKLFKSIAKTIDAHLTEEELEDLPNDGFFESDEEHRSVAITWSELQD